jgi:hypothetical protein
MLMRDVLTYSVRGLIAELCSILLVLDDFATTR